MYTSVSKQKIMICVLHIESETYDIKYFIKEAALYICLD